MIPEIIHLYLLTKWYSLVAIFGTLLIAKSGTLLRPDYKFFIGQPIEGFTDKEP